MSAFKPETIDHFTAEYAAENAVPLEEARKVVVALARRIEAQATSAVLDVTRTLRCPECSHRQTVDLDVDWTTQVGRRVKATWCCVDCGETVVCATTLRPGERKPADAD